MQIRSITIGQGLTWPLDDGAVEKAGAFAVRAKVALQSAGFPVQTLRFAAQPFSRLIQESGSEGAIAVAQTVEASIAKARFDYVALGPVLAASRGLGEGPGSPRSLIASIPDVLRATSRVFLSVMAATARDGLNLEAMRLAGQALVRSAEGDSEGAMTRRFALTANVLPNGPFFPSAYQDGPTGFSLALEAADLAVDAFAVAQTLDEATEGLRKRLEDRGGAVAAIAAGLAAREGIVFNGMDISLAPFPEEARSIGHALERLGAGRFGASGTLFAAALVTRVLSEVDLLKCGFSGLMIPLLEDATMASRHAEGAYTLDSLLLYSAVCGAGLDTIPVPGDITADQAASIYLDTSALSMALNKPLTVRLMPLAGRKAGDSVSFAFPYFAPTRVMTIGPPSPLLLEKGSWVRALGQQRP